MTPIPTNRATFTAAELAGATSGKWLAQSAREVIGICTDTRAIVPGNAFVALVGDRFDGHDYVRAALDAGATALVLSRLPHDLPVDARVVLVEDTLAALGALAAFHRRRWASSPAEDGARVVFAVGGSAGKTTTTRALAAVLDAELPGRVHATQGNLNNAIGVPMTLLGLTAAARVAVVEIGTNHRGEVESLAGIAAPDIGIVTLIEAEHLEGLGTIDDVAREEGDLFAALDEGGIAVGNGDDPRVVTQLTRARTRRSVRYGFGPGLDVRIASRTVRGIEGSDLVIQSPRGDARSFFVPMLGRAGALAAVAAVSAAEAWLGRSVDLPRVSAALAAVAGVHDGRLHVGALSNGTIVVNDAYNSNPGSVRSSLLTARELADGLGRRLVLVLGEMRELGAASAVEHAGIAIDVERVRPDVLITVCGDARRFAGEAPAAERTSVHVETNEQAAMHARELVRPGDVVLVKGSRGVALEKVVEALRTGA